MEKSNINNSSKSFFSTLKKIQSKIVNYRPIKKLNEILEHIFAIISVSLAVVVLVFILPDLIKQRYLDSFYSWLSAIFIYLVIIVIFNNTILRQQDDKEQTRNKIINWSSLMIFIILIFHFINFFSSTYELQSSVNEPGLVLSHEMNIKDYTEKDTFFKYKDFNKLIDGYSKNNLKLMVKDILKLKEEESLYENNSKLGLINEKLGNYEAAKKYFEKIYPKNENSIDLNKQLFRINEKTRNYELAKVYKKRYNLLKNKNDMLLKKLDLEYKVDQLKDSLGVNPKSARLHYELAVKLVKKADYSKAISEYKKAIDKGYSKYYVHNNIGVAYCYKNDLNNAEIHLRKAIDLNDDFAEAHLNLGILLYLKNYSKEAMRHMYRALQLNDRIIEAYAYLGLIKIKDAYYHDARVLLKKAIDLDSYYAPAYHNIGYCYLQEKKYKKSLEYFKKANKNYDKYDKNAESYFNTIYLNTYRVNRAINYETTGIVYEKLGRIDEAVASYKKSKEIYLIAGFIYQDKVERINRKLNKLNKAI